MELQKPHDEMRLSLFFSSRRRHTSSKRDWSSDVCSSDLSPRQATSVLRDEPSARSWPRRRNEPGDPRCCVAGMPVRIVDGWRKTSGTTRLFPMKIGRASCREGVENEGAGGADRQTYVQRR